MAFDVDGVLTDGRLWFGEDGRELKVFHVHDGLGLKRLKAAGVEVAVISARSSPVVAMRLAELGIVQVHQGQEDKAACFRRLLAACACPPEAAGFMGDDLPDLPALRLAGLAVAPANAVAEVIAAAHWVTHRLGGDGAVRELCEAILAARSEGAGAEP
ncbi:MAG: hypothetical protein KatS3mg125_2147 [Lysobacterales bacterium]|jgi:3-deoxy-D-manno-octulosonate 8-phosphate phosphatase (KDO 8-P phosphatase)|nr:MAG: hypothetical protein KatS3mg125_2147 [Xanthomonadales bacterium]